MSSDGTNSDPDVRGADGATLTHIRFGDTEIEVPQDDGTDITIPGEYGVLTIDKDGNYSYQRNEGSGGGNSDVFTYVLTDGDGDTAETTLTIEIEDADVGIEGLTGATGTGDVTVNESKLTDGTGEGDGAVSASNTFTVNSPDGIGNLSITHGSETIVLVTNNVVHDFAVDGPLTLTTDLGTLTVTGFIPGTGVVDYSYELTEDKAHTPGDDRNDGFESFTVNLSDMDGDTTSGTLGVRIVDDMPVITPTEAKLGKLEVSEASLGEPSDPVDFSVAFDYKPGADGEKERAYSFVVSDGVDTGLIDVASGVPIVLVDTNGDGTLITGTVGKGGASAFTIIIDHQTGEVVLTQTLALQHAGSGEEDTVLTLAEGALSLRLSVTDNDDDTTTSTVDNVGGYFSFEDDTPTIETDDAKLGSIQLDETGLVSAVDGSITTTVENFSTDVFTPDYGADDEAETNALVYSLEVINTSSGLTDSVSDKAILLRLNGSTGEVEAYTETSDDLVFTVSVDPKTGALTLTQYRAIEHGTPGTESEGRHNESISMASDLIKLVATATDGDGDSTPASVSISDKISFLDDGPAVAGAAESGVVNEKHLPLGSVEVKDPANLTATGSLRVTPSADGVNTQFAADIVAKLEDQGHQSGGEPLTYELSADGYTLTATTSEGGETVFVVTITNPTSADAGYEFVLSRALNHDSEEEDFDITFDIVVTDGDGDTDMAQFSVTVLDDAPVTSQAFTIPEDGSQDFNTTADSTPDNTFISQGGPLTGVDNLDGGKDYLTEHGKVTVNADGTITYTPAEN